MKIRMLRSLTGLRNGVRWPARGGELVVPDAEGASLCANGYAEPVVETVEPETRPAPAAAEKSAPEAPETRPARRAAAKRG